MTRKFAKKREQAVKDAKDSVAEVAEKTKEPRRKAKHLVGDTLMGCITRAMQVLLVAFVILISVPIVTTVIMPLSATFIVESNGLSADLTTPALVAMYYAPFGFICLLSFIGTCLLIWATGKWSGNMVKSARQAYEHRQGREIWTKEAK